MALNIRSVLFMFRPIKDLIEQNQYINFKHFINYAMEPRNDGPFDIYRVYGQFYGVDRPTGKQMFLQRFFDGTDISGYQIYRIYIDPDSDTIQIVLVPEKNINSKGEVI
jgi:hypothetical protein